MKQARQGDVFIERVRSPKTSMLTPIEAEQGRVVLAHGEATGHAHAIPADHARLYEHPKTKARYLRVVQPTELRHEEHRPIALRPGMYRITRQRVYEPKGIRTVAD